ncbi:MAG: NADH-quinone oxidoreductase subunit C [Bacteroidales bacterium]|jgi:Ni,Fe-hydrogenase III component G|nr:NADH-quinone oxidoreductase subunit C [Bacteroidales bacterium]
MNNEAIIGELRKKFGNDVLETEEQSSTRLTVTIEPLALLKVAEHLYREAGLRFIIASAIHTKKGFEILYHFSNDETGLVLNIHVILNSEKPRIESLSNMFNASNWIEREMHELFGIDFLNHPNQEKLISEGNWAEGVYPYRKEFKK